MMRFSTFCGFAVGVAIIIFSEPAFTTSLAFFANEPNDYDYGRTLVIPPDFGSGEFTFEIWIKLDDSYPVGSTFNGSHQRMNWSDADNLPYGSEDWWWMGNFLLDGHNNSVFQDGTFSLQFYGGGRIRWLFGDGAFAGPGGHWSVGAFPATNTPSLLDGEWHHVALVRRFEVSGVSALELWVDGELIDSEASPVRTNMRSYWDSWSGYPSGNDGWYLGSEKQAAVGWLTQYEDFKGLVGEIRFFDRAKSAVEIAANWMSSVEATTPGVVGLYRLSEGVGLVTCDELQPSRCIDLINMKTGYWSTESPPMDGIIFADDFESGTTGQWSNGG